MSASDIVATVWSFGCLAVASWIVGGWVGEWLHAREKRWTAQVKPEVVREYTVRTVVNGVGISIVLRSDEAGGTLGVAHLALRGIDWRRKGSA